MMDGYVAVLEEHLGVKRTRFSFKDRWAEDSPPAAEGRSFEEYLNEVFSLASLWYVR